MTEGQFTAADLEPSDDDKRAARRSLIDRVAASVAVLSTGVWIGGMIALGACAAPFVFEMTPAPASGYAMGAAFARFDQIAIGAAVLLLGAEVARTLAAGRRSRSLAARVRRLLAVLMALGAVYTGLKITPRILTLHHEGARRGLGEGGAELERIHHHAEAIGKGVTLAGVIVIALHVFTLGAKKPDDEEEDAPAPLPPGPSD
jgi:uncharacterized protein DUF4149